MREAIACAKSPLRVFFASINLRNAWGDLVLEWPLSALPSLYVNYDANEETRFSGNFHFQRQKFVLQCMLIG
jgi:hypothetical protein